MPISRFGSDITCTELQALPEDSFRFVDLRCEADRIYGSIPASLTYPQLLSDAAGCTPPDGTYVVYDLYGAECEKARAELQAAGYTAVSLRGGYAEYLDYLCTHENPERQHDVEVSLRKKFHACLFTPFAKGINQYALLQEGDRIAVCIGSGKAPLLLAKLFQELKRHNKFPFELVFMVLDPGFHPLQRRLLEGNLKQLGIPAEVFDAPVSGPPIAAGDDPCGSCAAKRLDRLYQKANELGCNKIALGDHYDDVIETILSGMLYGAKVETLMPKERSSTCPGMELIRPMYLLHETDIARWSAYNHLSFFDCACPFTENRFKTGTAAASGNEIRSLIAELKKSAPDVESHIFRSMENVNLDTVLGWVGNGTRHSFLEDYDETTGAE